MKKIDNIKQKILKTRISSLVESNLQMQSVQRKLREYKFSINSFSDLKTIRTRNKFMSLSNEEQKSFCFTLAGVKAKELKKEILEKE